MKKERMIELNFKNIFPSNLVVPPFTRGGWGRSVLVSAYWWILHPHPLGPPAAFAVVGVPPSSWNHVFPSAIRTPQPPGSPLTSLTELLSLLHRLPLISPASWHWGAPGFSLWTSPPLMPLPPLLSSLTLTALKNSYAAESCTVVTKN